MWCPPFKIHPDIWSFLFFLLNLLAYNNNLLVLHHACFVLFPPSPRLSSNLPYNWVIIPTFKHQTSDIKYQILKYQHHITPYQDQIKSNHQIKASYSFILTLHIHRINEREQVSSIQSTWNGSEQSQRIKIILYESSKHSRTEREGKKGEVAAARKIVVLFRKKKYPYMYQKKKIDDNIV